MGAHYRTRRDAAQQNGLGLKQLAGITAGFSTDFAAVLGCEAKQILDVIESGRVEPFTAVGSADDPDRFALSFLEEEYEHLKELVA